MALTTLSPINDAAIQLPAGRSVQGFDRARRPRGIHPIAYAIGLILLAPCTTFALELGEASIKSGLGQSLLVEIPYRLAGNERVTSACIGLVPAANAADALPTYARVTRISITSTHIEIFDDNRVVEPLIGLNVDVHCNEAPHFVRSYQLFVDPPAQTPTIFSNGAEVAVARTQPATDTAAPVAAARPETSRSIRDGTAITAATPDTTASAAIPTTARANVSPRARGLEGGDLPQGQTYRVVRGDTLSGIAARVAGRPVTIVQAADAIFAANPAAFTRGNPDLIEAGRTIAIPNLTPSEVALAAPSAPAPTVVRATELPTAAPVAAANPVSAPPSPTEPLRADDATSVDAPVASQPLPAVAPAVSKPVPAPVAAPTPTDVVAEAPSRGRMSASLIAVLALGVVIAVSAVVVFVRRRRDEYAAPPTGSRVREPVRRPPIELASRIDVVEGSLGGSLSGVRTAAMRGAEIAPATDSGDVLPADLKDLALSIGSTDAVDFNVGDPGVTNERVVELDTRGPIIDARDDTMEQEVATARMRDIASEPTVRQLAPRSKPDDSQQRIDDEKHALTIVELDILRQDYEAEHTLTQQSSQALRDAVADLEATKKAHAATAETSTMESPELSTDDAADAPTARIRAK